MLWTFYWFLRIVQETAPFRHFDCCSLIPFKLKKLGWEGVSHLDHLPSRLTQFSLLFWLVQKVLRVIDVTEDCQFYKLWPKQHFLQLRTFCGHTGAISKLSLCGETTTFVDFWCHTGVIHCASSLHCCFSYSIHLQCKTNSSQFVTCMRWHMKTRLTCRFLFFLHIFFCLPFFNMSTNRKGSKNSWRISENELWTLCSWLISLVTVVCILLFLQDIKMSIVLHCLCISLCCCACTCDDCLLRVQRCSVMVAHVCGELVVLLVSWCSINN